MKTKLFLADSRGYADHGWLKSSHSFSFASYFNPNQMNFGALRVLNDDWVAPSMGFGTHGHKDMEIISIPLSGDLKHRDNMGNETVIRSGDIQVMSAGSGVEHSEMNASSSEPVAFLQIWIFPKVENVTPRYDQITLKVEDSTNQWQQILSPNKEDEGVWIHQDAFMHLNHLDSQGSATYTLKNAANGVFLFVIEGEVIVEGEQLGRRDAIGITEVAQFTLKAQTNTKLLAIEVPMA
ncbi:MAG: pirin family protein [Flavobacteriaceae bacterium]